MAELRAVDEAILQRDAKAAPQEALSFRPPDNSPFRRHFTRGFLLCLYAYSTRFAWECQCPFCTNPPGVSLCRLRDARSGGGPVRRKNAGGAGKRARRARFSLRQGRGAESLSAHRQRGGRIAYLWYAVDSTAFSRAPSDRLRFSHAPADGRTEKRRAAGCSCGAALFSPGQTSFAFLPNSLRISGRSRRGARKQ